MPLTRKKPEPSVSVIVTFRNAATRNRVSSGTETVTITVLPDASLARPSGTMSIRES